MTSQQASLLVSFRDWPELPGHSFELPLWSLVTVFLPGCCSSLTLWWEGLVAVCLSSTFHRLESVWCSTDWVIYSVGKSTFITISWHSFPFPDHTIFTAVPSMIACYVFPHIPLSGFLSAAWKKTSMSRHYIRMTYRIASAASGVGGWGGRW